jgi:hypothetical protein
MSLTPATQALLAWPFRMLRTELGRRAAAAMLVSATLATTVQTLYANADAPSRPVQAAARAAGAGASQAEAPRAGTSGTPAAAAAGGQPARPAAKPSAPPAGKGDEAAGADDPGKVAVAWYARKRGVAVGKVKLLQQRRKDDDEVRVLVMVELGDRLDTAEVKVRRTRTGWRVP